MNRLHVRNWTIRGRLTAIYGGLFFLAGAVLLALTYLLVWQILNRNTPQMPDSAALRTVLSRVQAAFGGNPNIGGLQFGQETADKFEVGANYALGPGIKVLGGVQYYNFAGPSNAVAAQSWAILLGMDVLGTVDGLMIDYRRSEMRILPHNSAKTPRLRIDDLPTRLP